MNSQRDLVSSLFSLSLDWIIKNLTYYTNQTESLQNLPFRVKTRLLKKFLISSSLQKRIDFNTMLTALVHPHLNQIDLSSLSIDDSSLKSLEMCHKLQEINLRNCTLVSSKSLSNFFKNVRFLNSVDVSKCTNFDDYALQSLADYCPNLSLLQAEYCPISDTGFIYLLQRNKHIKCLTLCNTNVTGIGIRAIVEEKSCSNLCELRLDNCRNVTEEILKTVIENCPNIEIFTFYNCIDTDGASLFKENMSSCKNLKQLHWSVSW